MLVVDEVVGEDRLWRLALQFGQRGKPHLAKRGAVRVQDVVVRVADRHRLGQRVEDLAEAGIAPAQLCLELA